MVTGSRGRNPVTRKVSGASTSADTGVTLSETCRWEPPQPATTAATATTATKLRHFTRKDGQKTGVSRQTPQTSRNASQISPMVT
jgi:hypothetical protein